MVRRYLVIALSALALTGCATTNPFAGISSPPQEPKKMANYAQTEKQVPLKVGVTPDGKDVIAFASERTYTAGSTEVPEKLGFLQKVGRWVGGLSILAIIFIVVSLAFFGGVPIIWAAKKYYAMKAALKHTVAAIDEIKPEHFEAIKPALAEAQDTSDKKLIAKLKAEI